ncbi:MAG: cytochrome c maturation protein CcmE [Deltaproteobacteria bacterium]|nr:cytochrome c maturation protein CcmE [Deltaproteobacteria bacterium]
MKRRKGLILFSLLGIAGALAYVLWGGLEENLVYFVTPSELLAKGEKAVGNTVRLGGVVEAGTVQFESSLLSFDLSDDHQKVPVVTTAAPPQMFQEGMGVIVEGKLGPDQRFVADRLMVRHGNEYRPPKEGEMPQEIYRELKNPPSPPFLKGGS